MTILFPLLSSFQELSDSALSSHTLPPPYKTPAGIVSTEIMSDGKVAAVITENPKCCPIAKLK